VNGEDKDEDEDDESPFVHILAPRKKVWRI